MQRSKYLRDPFTRNDRFLSIGAEKRGRGVDKMRENREKGRPNPDELEANHIQLGVARATHRRLHDHHLQREGKKERESEK